MILRIVVEDTTKKLNSTIGGITTVGGVCKRRPFYVSHLSAASAAPAPNEVKNSFNSCVDRLNYLPTWNTVPDFPHCDPLLVVDLILKIYLLCVT